MQDKIKQKRQDIKIIILNVVIGVLVFFLLITGIYALEEFSYEFDNGYTEDSFIYRIKDERYNEMVRMYHENEAYGKKFGEEGQEYYAIAKYYEAAYFYKAFSEAGDTERMERYLDKMEDAEEDMGAMAFVKDKIDEKLGIQ